MRHSGLSVLTADFPLAPPKDGCTRVRATLGIACTRVRDDQLLMQLLLPDV